MSPYARTPSQELRRRAVELGRLREKLIAQIGRELGIAESGLPRWMAQEDIDEGEREGLSIGDCFDDSLAESFFATLPTELLGRSTWPTREGQAQAVFDVIENFDNPSRRSSTLGYLSPVDYEQTWRAGRLTETAA